jgi:hypothetical protein
MQKIISRELRALIARLINKSSLSIRKRMPWFFSFLSKQKVLRKIYLRNKQFSLVKKSIPEVCDTQPQFSNNNNEICAALKQYAALWPERKRLHA